MITVSIATDEEKVKEIITSLLSKIGNINIGIIKQGDAIKISEKGNLRDIFALEEKIIELEDSLYSERRGALYKSILEAVEKPLIERVLGRAEGNQLKAARILGINRNTIRSKIKKLGINLDKWKVI